MNATTLRPDGDMNALAAAERSGPEDQISPMIRLCCPDQQERRGMTVSRIQDFERVVLPHLDAAYNLARWLVRDATLAEDVVQDAALRALRYFASFRGGDGRAWI